ncbi:MAG TPA: hypothetical protein VNV44_11825 [Solirubrobacteraceae bacterium]|nr:hypothetical protein [Solirubrobacteraceae bacterium]
MAASAIAASPAWSQETFTFHNWPVTGSLTPKKLGEPVVLPKGSVFNGGANVVLTRTEAHGTLHGTLTVPPFTAQLKLLGLLPTEVGITMTEVGESLGTLSPLPPSDCANQPGYCVEATVDAKANIALDFLGTLGLHLPVHCVTTEPIDFKPSAALTLVELAESGPHFKGTTTIPPLNCEGVEGLLLTPVVNALMAGPENPYALHISEIEPAPPVVATAPAEDTTQVSTHLAGTVNPQTETVTDCHFEYGPTTEYGHSIPCANAPGNGLRNVNVSAVASGLAENTEYHYRLVATNALGTTTSSDATVLTLSGAAGPHYGRCVAQKGGNYVDPGCSSLKMVKGKPVEHAGKYEFVAGPAPTCVPVKKGEYTDSGCTAKSTKPHKGTFEKAGGAGYAISGGAVTLESGGAGLALHCTGAAGQGLVTGTNAGTAQLALSGCESHGEQCTSEGANSKPSGQSGTIDTNALDTRLLGPVTPRGESSQVWNEFVSGEHQPYLAEFGCGSALYRISGSVAGIERGDIGVMTSSSTLEFEPTGGEQAGVAEASTDGGKTWGAPSPAVAAATLTNAYASQIEIKP